MGGAAAESILIALAVAKSGDEKKVLATYNGSFSIGVTADRDALPDPATYAQCMEAAFQELLAAAG